ncbi:MULTISPECIES: hypothetical protein [Chryseobacterium]|uniref:CHASE2 domain-containing sensor protein n=1 Tax=Chryseobacterium camelliae TaxID=1265445 RepID=A0ABU0TH84_9FLAO|nr:MULTISPECIES: hypothetical protein [Chryseobacterium]MDT3405857.1 CHASE2 domain-containing sensor protein [Pseudacidovorax intermedius]MDQ1096336.1 CHASE2 domain-containing sensor protein [Chryseobacterium camelliae]MDQ1100275.1 CHASE2 domain-containing sensor protein [Chryseobacterium sp. SORGH_AS_1048]MDR6087618.1 CHASE2 domain-containing sensor protein [Chryseobacterium sp. SORGH_AS_0909]MDR6131992.1 CHASE2 domain-containing sensor protein [Chryseobacterium sp. SORGH_AS_1175]
MKNIQLAAVLLVVIGSFLPLVHIPVIGNWNYWKLDHFLASGCWILCALALWGIINNHIKIIRYSAVLLIILFIFTLFAVKVQAFQYFSFMPFKSWAETLAGVVKLRWGWIVEFGGALLLLLAKNKKPVE